MNDAEEVWETRACKGENTNMFFASQGSVDTMRAKNICAECPARCRLRCLNEALALPESEDFGVLGGLDEWERKKLRKRQSA